MNEYKSLATALAGFFDRQQCDLPKELQARVEDEYSPISWDRMSPEARQQIAVQLDSYDDPALEDARQRGWDLAEREAAIDVQISEWSRVATPTALDLATRNEKLAQLKLQKSQIEAEVRGESLARELSYSAHWQKYSPRKEEWIACDPSSKHVKNLLNGQVFSQLWACCLATVA